MKISVGQNRSLKKTGNTKHPISIQTTFILHTHLVCAFWNCLDLLNHRQLKRIYMSFASQYTLDSNKAEKKGRTKEVVDKIVEQLTSYDQKAIHQQIEKENSFELFLEE